ncbi:MAG: glycosyltransferase family 4 protein [Anaerolineales bacterium]|jgi:glycosyltransferase involved in cell wall biosynthesis|nr:glycosyltransferase family 4 protein [Anaerolineales bacterium]
MKILVLCHEFPPVGGGGGRVARDIARGLAERGHEIRILTDRLDGLPPVETQAGLQIERIPARRKQAFQAEFSEMARYDLAAFQAGLGIIRTWKPDVIHAHFAVPAGAAAFALSKLTKVPYLLTAHLGDVPGAVPDKTERWFKLIYPLTPQIWKSAARVVAVSEFTRSLALKHYPVPVEVIHNGVERSALPKWQPASDGSPRLIFAARFVAHKNPADLVEALARLAYLPWTCIMAGDGEQLETVRALVERHGLEKRIHLPGWVSPEQVLEHFAASDILVLPSRSEGLSVVAVQGLAMGLALVLSAAGGNPELVQPGENGFLFQPGDVTALTAALESLLSSPTKVAAFQARSRAMSAAFDLEKIVYEYEKILEKAAHGKYGD